MSLITYNKLQKQKNLTLLRLLRRLIIDNRKVIFNSYLKKGSIYISQVQFKMFIITGQRVEEGNAFFSEPLASSRNLELYRVSRKFVSTLHGQAWENYQGTKSAMRDRSKRK